MMMKNQQKTVIFLSVADSFRQNLLFPNMLVLLPFFWKDFFIVWHVVLVL